MHRVPILLLSGFLACSAVPAFGGTVADSAEEIRPLLIGAEIPDVTLRDIDGKAVNLRKAVAKKPAAFIFYRGGW